MTDLLHEAHSRSILSAKWLFTHTGSISSYVCTREAGQARLPFYKPLSDRMKQIPDHFHACTAQSSNAKFGADMEHKLA